MAEKKIPWPDWRIIKRIGNGNYGSVYEIERQDINGHIEKAALKVMSIPKEESDIDFLQAEGYTDAEITTYYGECLKYVLNEYAMMSELKGHPNIVSCEDRKAEVQENGIGWNVYIRMELLTPFIKAAKGKDLSEEETVKLGKDLCRALIACHSRSIIHRDIKPENVFISKYGDYKLGDFGVARVMSHTTNATKTGTPYYMAPEVCKDEPYGKEVDIYSLGMVLYWLMNRRRLPFMPIEYQPTPTERERAYKRRIEGEEIEAPLDGNDELKRIILKATAYDPKNRYHSAEELLKDLEGWQKEETKSEESVVVEEQTEKEKYQTIDVYQTSDIKRNTEKEQIQEEEPVTEQDSELEEITENEDSIEEDSYQTVNVYQAELLNRRAEKKQTKDEEKEKSAKETIHETQEIVKQFEQSEESGVHTELKKPDQKKQSNASDKDKGNKSIFLLLLAAAVLICGVLVLKNLKKNEPVADSEKTASDIEEPDTDSKEEETENSDTNNTADEYNSSSTWTDIISISAGDWNTLGLRSDGTVIAVGDNTIGQCDVSEWTDIIAISEGNYLSVGLKSDGTVVVAGNNRYGQCDVSGWKDIIAVSAGDYHTVGLKSDGTVVAVGSNSHGQCDVSRWQDIIAISAGNDYTVGLKDDGTVVAVGENPEGQCDVSGWKDIIAISASYQHTVGLKKDGTVVAIGEKNAGQCNVSDWTDIIAVSAGNAHTIGLKSDGTVVAVGDNWHHQCDVSDWKDIIAVSAGDYHTVGLKSDGTVVAVGDYPNY